MFRNSVLYFDTFQVIFISSISGYVILIRIFNFTHQWWYRHFKTKTFFSFSVFFNNIDCVWNEKLALYRIIKWLLKFLFEICIKRSYKIAIIKTTLHQLLHHSLNNLLILKNINRFIYTLISNQTWLTTIIWIYLTFPH